MIPKNEKAPAANEGDFSNNKLNLNGTKYLSALARLAADPAGPDADLEVCAIAHKYGKTEAQVLADLEKAHGAVIGDPWPPALNLTETSDLCTDAANAQRFAEINGHDLTFIVPWGWYRFTGNRWTEAQQYAARCAQELGASIRDESIREALAANNTELSRSQRDAAQTKAENLLKWAKTSESARSIEAALKLAAAHIYVKAADMDQHRWLLNCSNGTLDLRTGRLRPPRRGDLLTKCTNQPYLPDASCDLWKRTVLAICCGDRELMDYLQRVIGYCLTGDIREQLTFIFNGPGANGKDTFLTKVQQAMGDYAALAAPNLLIESRGERHPTEVADLAGVRLAIASESNEQGRLNEVAVKRFVGSEKLKARMMRQDFFEFDVQFKLVLMTNHRPVIEGSDYGIWRRIHLVPFNATFKGEAQDKALPQKLEKELPGILAWCVQGCLEWQRIGLQPPEIVRLATAQYRADQDVLRDFFDGACRFIPAEQVTAKALYHQYESWCHDNGERPKSAKWLWSKLQERGVSKEKQRMGVLYRGIGLIQQVES
jgi:putative DNA primase/helicase